MCWCFKNFRYEMIENSNNDSSRNYRILHYTWIWEYVLLFILIMKLITNICSDKSSYYSWASDHIAVLWHVAYLYIEISYAGRWICISFKDINSCYIQNSEEWMSRHFLKALSVKKRFYWLWNCNKNCDILQFYRIKFHCEMHINKQFVKN